MLPRPPLLLALSLLLAGLSGCSSSRVPWVNPELPREDATRDYAACRRYADDQADPTYGASEAMRADTVVSRADREDAKRRRALALRSCMEAKGYKPAEPSR